MKCNECNRKCCYDLNVTNRENFDKNGTLIPLSIKKYPIGSIINVSGITFKRNNNKLWDCVDFNKETEKCMIYEKRPFLCRTWHCSEEEFIKENFDKELLKTKFIISFLVNKNKI